MSVLIPVRVSRRGHHGRQAFTGGARYCLEAVKQDHAWLAGPTRDYDLPAQLLGHPLRPAGPSDVANAGGEDKRDRLLSRAHVPDQLRVGGPRRNAEGPRLHESAHVLNMLARDRLGADRLRDRGMRHSEDKSQDSQLPHSVLHFTFGTFTQRIATCIRKRSDVEETHAAN